MTVQPSETRSYKDFEYERAGVKLNQDLSKCDVLLGIKEVPVASLINNKTYLFFSHTKKKQPHNKHLLQAILQKKITLIDYECLEHEDGQRIIGFGFLQELLVHTTELWLMVIEPAYIIWNECTNKKTLRTLYIVILV
ncbi:hypothetical protein MKP09_03295 [Niabella ginsengisoli]|uniref:Alanine dehydrogenase/pyridine nucleotide transhydrogenase N-terminal domain-containing protein n=1 Tax=Niabella ginsengisoli TaxID=522298 RepID=A0ABS9SF95_9BACT|nr:hypothetical protein [Niabella ginsengisoli]